MANQFQRAKGRLKALPTSRNRFRNKSHSTTAATKPLKTFFKKDQGKFSCSDIPDKHLYQEISLSIKSSSSTFPHSVLIVRSFTSLFYIGEIHHTGPLNVVVYRMPSSKQGSVIVRYAVFLCVWWNVYVSHSSCYLTPNIESWHEKDSGAFCVRALGEA